MTKPLPDSANTRKDRDAELRRLLDQCPEEVLMLLLQLLQDRKQPLASATRQP
jgi:hypothetical protein